MVRQMVADFQASGTARGLFALWMYMDLVSAGFADSSLASFPSRIGMFRPMYLYFDATPGNVQV